jgi:hypothetical protein
MASQIGNKWKLSSLFGCDCDSFRLIPINCMLFDQDPAFVLHHFATPSMQEVPAASTSTELPATPPDGILSSATTSQRWIPAGYESDPYWLRTTQQPNCVVLTTFCQTMATTILCLLSSATSPPHQERCAYVQQHFLNINSIHGSFR